MSLPAITTPEFEAELPSTKQKIRFRPYLVKEQKILYMALEAKESGDVLNAIIQIMKNCILSEVDVEKFTSYDLEYLFLLIRAKSVNEVVTLRMRHTNPDNECKHLTEVNVNIDDIKVQFDPKHENVIQLTKDIGIKLKDPTIATLHKVQSLENKSNTIADFIDPIYQCVESIFSQDMVYEDYTLSEFRTWIEHFNKEQFEKIVNFFATLPKVQHRIEWTCPKCGTKESVVVEGLQNFFT